MIAVRSQGTGQSVASGYGKITNNPVTFSLNKEKVAFSKKMTDEVMKDESCGFPRHFVPRNDMIKLRCTRHPSLRGGQRPTVWLTYSSNTYGVCLRKRVNPFPPSFIPRHCEERSDVAIRTPVTFPLNKGKVALPKAMTDEVMKDESYGFPRHFVPRNDK